MKHLINAILIASLFALTLYSCDNRKQLIGIDMEQCHILSESGGKVHFGPLSDWTYKPGSHSYVIPYGGSIEPYQANQQYHPRKGIKTEIITDSRLGTTIDGTTLAMVDTIMKKLCLGIELVDISQPEGVNLERVKTVETYNSAKILDSLKQCSFDNEKNLHIYLFSHAEFFKTSSAFAFNSGDHHFILGNKDLFNSSLLFVHELGHSFGLGHNNRDHGCGLYNIMHESNIGCAILLDPQQALIVGADDYITFNKETKNMLPIGHTDDCKCDTTYYKSKMDEYINAKDRSIDNLALVGDYESISPKLLIEAESGVIDPAARSSFEGNFQNISKILFSDPTNQNTFVTQSLAGLAKLRQHNLLRLIGANIERSHLFPDFDANDMFTDSLKRKEFIDFHRNDLRSNPLMSVSNCEYGSLVIENNQLRSKINQVKEQLIVQNNPFQIKLDSLQNELSIEEMENDESRRNIEELEVRIKDLLNRLDEVFNGQDSIKYTPQKDELLRSLEELRKPKKTNKTIKTKNNSNKKDSKGSKKN